MTKDFRKVFAMKEEREKRIKKICPDIPNSSGIYVFCRIDEAGIRRAYCGQAVNLLERCASHLGEYDHIALSLKKHGFYGNENPYGWKLDYRTYPKSELDDKEVKTIKSFADKGFQMYNVTAGISVLLHLFQPSCKLFMLQSAIAAFIGIFRYIFRMLNCFF